MNMSIFVNSTPATTRDNEYFYNLKKPHTKEPSKILLQWIRYHQQLLASFPLTVSFSEEKESVPFYLSF